MIWRLEYENAHGDVARLDIQRGAPTPVEIIEGTEDPFLLSYELEDKNKKGFIMSSFADISIYETATFNIDDLKTLDETALSVKWYINSVLEWTGFVVPDFFSRTIGEPAIVNLAASDRLSSLEDATLDGLSEYVKIKDLAIACLAKTGLSLPLISTVDFKTGTTNVMDVFARSERLEDDKGKKISCYDVLRSILVLTNSTIRQRKGQWRIYNKIQHEAVAPTLTFNEVHQGAKRTIQPVFSSVGAFQEFGGIRTYPKNNSFESDGLTWTPKNGFVTEFDNRDISYDPITNSMVFGEVTNRNQLINRNVVPDIFAGFENMALLSSSKIDIPFNGESEINFSFEINAKGLSEAHSGRFYVEKKIQGKASEFLSDVGTWRKEGQISHRFGKYMLEYADNIVTIKSKIEIPANANPDDYSLVVHIGGIYDRGLQINNEAIAIRSLKIIFDEKSDAKGILYRTDQLGNFSKKSDSDTTIFGDYISSGLNGYFYPYSEDDTSVLRAPSGSNLPLSKWTTATDPTAGELPILQHVTRQISRMFGVAHNILSAVIDAKTFDPLAIVTNCAGEKYVIVAATFDFLRSTVEVELQQIAYGSLLRRDFIFSYFGGGDGDGISSIGSVSGGGSSSGGGGGGGIPQTLDLIVDELFISGGNSVDLGVYARKTWVETEATAFNSARLGGQLASKYTRRDVDESITGGWDFRRTTIIRSLENANAPTLGSSVNTSLNVLNSGGQFGLLFGVSGTGRSWIQGGRIDSNVATYDIQLQPSGGNVGIGLPGNASATERLHVVGNGLFTGNLTAQKGTLTSLDVSGISTLRGEVILSDKLRVAKESFFADKIQASNAVSQSTGWQISKDGIADFRHIYVDEMQAKAFTADISQALVGSDILTKSVAKLAETWTTTANNVTSSIFVEELEGFSGYQVFEVGDYLLLRLFDRTGGGLLIKNIWATVSIYVGTVKNVQEYKIKVVSGGLVNHSIYKGSMALDYGKSGSGVIERTVLDQLGSPYSQVRTWTGTPYGGNFTTHYRSGNLNGIANAEGWGMYSQNSFLTGKLLVGDLTKAGQFMEYENGQLNIKGQITVTGGNAATKEDVDAVQVGGRNLILDSEKILYKDNKLGSSSVSIFTNNFLFKRNSEYVFSFDVKGTGATSFVVSNYSTPISSIASDGQVGSDNGGSIRFNTSGKYNRIWIKIKTDNWSVEEVEKPINIWVRENSEAWVKNVKLELGNRSTDWTPAPEDVPSALEYLTEALVGDTNIAGGLVTTNLLMVKDTNGTVSGGMSGLKSDNIGFWAGGSYQEAISNNANVIFRKDGSFSLAGGKIIGTSAGAATIEGGLITGMIESSNYNGTVGSRFDLHNGHLVIGDAIRMSGDTSEIHVVDRDTGLDSFRIGDFRLTPTYNAGAGVDVLLSSSPVTALPTDGSYQLNRTVYVSGSGALFTSAAVISNSLIPGGTYNFQAYLKVVLSSLYHMDTVPEYIMSEGFYGRGGGIRMQLKNGNTVVWAKNISTIPKDGVVPLLISTSFQAVSPQLQLIITIDGEFEYRVPDGTGTKFYNTWVSIERFDSSSRLVLRALLSRMEFSTKGMQAVFSNTNYFRCDSTRIQGRGTQIFISPNGNYILRVSNDGIEKSTDSGDNWTAL